MNPLIRVAAIINRHRHKRGFGVHSPFGFYFITQVIAENIYGYYCYDRLDGLAKAEGLKPARMRLLMRIAGALGGREIVGIGTGEAENVALSCYHGSRISDRLDKYYLHIAQTGERGLVYIADPSLPVSVEKLIRVVESGGTVIVGKTDTEKGKTIAGCLEPYGMTFAGRDLCITVGRSGLPSQRIETVI